MFLIVYCKYHMCNFCGEFKRNNGKMRACNFCICKHNGCLNLAKINLGNLNIIHEISGISQDVVKYIIMEMVGSRIGNCVYHCKV